MDFNAKTNPGRESRLQQLEEDKVWDVLIIGGGATGAGIAVDAAARGFSTVLFDTQDFSEGTSSRSTKLIHGGVRYMKNPRDWKLVREAMIERKLLLGNAPHIVHPEPFILPCYENFEREYYMAGLCLYGAMAYGGYEVGKTGMFIPKTSDGRVLFCIPWHGVLEIGTTDKEEKDISFNPEPTEEEIEFMLETARKYLAYPISRKDVLASFAGLRPLFNPNAGGSTAAVSREHSVIPEFKNMITVTGGKWTAYRKMAEHAMSVAVDQGLIYKRPCPTKYMSIYRDNEFNPDEIEAEILKGTLTDEQLKAYAVHCRDTQFAMTPEDVLYRRLRIGQMNKAKTEELLLKIKDVFEAEASE